MRKLLLLFIFPIISLSVFSQDFSNKGKDFWVAYGYHVSMFGSATGGAQQMVLYFATDQVTNITISIPGVGYTQTLTSGAGNNVLTSAIIPKVGVQEAKLLVEGTSDKGIHITSDKPMVSYAHIYNASISGATILYPTNTLGKEYYSINYKNWSNSLNSNCWFYVVATDTGSTRIEITPTGNTAGGWVAGNTYTVNLTQGQVYNVMGALINSPNNCNPVCTGYDLTGSKIKSINTGSGCKKIAVFSGSGKLSITCNNNNSSADNYMVQAVPKTAWGNKYLTTPAAGNQSYNFYRVCVLDPTTVVKINGVVTALPLQGGFYYEIYSTNQPQRIEGDKPIMVAQYFTSQGACSNGTPGDPEVIYLSPVEQNINTVIWNATPNSAITGHYFNVVLPNTGTAISSFTLDGVSVPASSFTVHPQDPSYSYLRQSVGSGQRIIKSDSGFNAIAYGFGSAESYGYNAGTNIKDLYQQIGVQTVYGIETTPSVCTGAPFKFKVSLPYIPDSMYWNFYGIGGMFPNNNNVTINNIGNVAEDSTTVVNGKTLHWYSLPTFYNFNTVGVYPITIRTYVPNADCGSTQDIDFDLSVSSPPIADFSWGGSGCVAETYQFTELTSQTPKPTYHFWWNFGDPASGVNNTSDLRNPQHLFSAPGTYTVRFSDITTPGCLSDTIVHQVIVPALPTATITGTTELCLNAPNPQVTFTASGGTAPFTFTYNINGGPVQTINTSTGNSITINVPTNVAGIFNYNLLGVSNTGSILCAQNQTGTATIKINTIPTASITGNAIVCLNAASPNISFNGANGTLPYTFTYNINGGPNLTVTTTIGNSVNVIVPTAAVGTFIYNLVSVSDGSASICGQSQSGIATVVINNLPTATISGSNNICLNTTSPLISFTGASGTTPYTFFYTINNGPLQSVISSAGNTATVAVPSNIAGTFTYDLVSVQDASASLCTNLQSGTAVIVVFPLPLVNFTNTLPSCETRDMNFTDISTISSGSLTNWSWNFGDPSSGVNNNSTLQHPVHTFNSSGSYTINLTVTSSNGCSNVPFSKTVVINNRPLAGYIIPEVCLSDTYAQFFDSSKVALGTIVSWLWNFDDANATAPNPNTSTLQNPLHSYTAVGTYNVRLIATSNTGCRDTIIQPLVINGSFPVAGFTVNNPAILCANDSVAIVNTSTVFPGTITKVEIYWDNVNFPAVFQSDDFPVSGKVYRHLYPNFQSPLTRSFTIRYRAYSGGVCVNDKISTITVNAAPRVQFNAVPDVCLTGAPIQITQASELGGVPGTFVFTGPGVSTSGLFSPALTGIGTFNVKYTFTSATGGCVDTAWQTIKVLDTASARFSFVQPVCDGTLATFIEESIAPNGVVLNNSTWNFGDGSPLETHAPGSTFTHSFPSWGNYTVTMYNTSAYGCKSTNSIQQIYISPIPVTSFSFVEPSVCLPKAAVSFVNSSTIADATENAFTYLWNFGEPASGTLNTSLSKTPSPHIYSGLGPYTVTLTVTSGNNCTQSFTRVVNFIHPQPKADFIINKPGVCIGEDVSFTDQSIGLDGTVDKWNWNFGDGNTSTLRNPTHLYTSAATFNVQLFITNSQGCNSDTLSKPFIVYPYPIVSAGPDRIVLQGGAVTIQSAVSGNNLQYLWSPATYLNNTTSPTPTASNLQDDITYRLTVIALGGCTAFDEVFVKVLKTPKIPNTFSPNGDGINETWQIDYLETYPDNRVQVFTRTGQLVFESRGYKTAWNGTMNGKSLPIDTYYYIIEPGSGRKPVTGYVTILK